MYLSELNSKFISIILLNLDKNKSKKKKNIPNMANILKISKLNHSFLANLITLFLAFYFSIIVSSSCSSGYYPYFGDDTNCLLCSSVIVSCNTCVWDTSYKTVYCSTCNSEYYIANQNTSK